MTRGVHVILILYTDVALACVCLIRSDVALSNTKLGLADMLHD